MLDEEIKRLVASMMVIFVLSILMVPRMTAQECSDMLNTVSWDTLTWTPGNLIDSFSWPLIDGVEDVKVKIEVIPVDEMLNAGEFAANAPKIDSGMQQSFSLLSELGIGLRSGRPVDGRHTH